MPQRRKLAARPAKAARRTKVKAAAPTRRPIAAASKKAESLAPKNLGIGSTRDAVSTLSDTEARDLALRCRDAALEKKAEGVVMLDIRARAGFADYFVIATGRSVIQARAVADAVVEGSEVQWGAPLRIEGYKDGTWILIDYGAVIAHVFTVQAREFYNLERLWGKPPPPAKRKA